MKRILIYLVFSLMGLIITGYAGSVPQLINYQGELKTQDDANSFTGSKKFEFNIYDASINGNKIWGPQIFNSVPVIQGTYNVILGTTDSVGRSIADAFDSQQRFLGVTIDGDEIEPRQQVLSSPFALHAGVADYADQSGHAVNADKTSQADYANSSWHAVNADKAKQADYTNNSGHAVNADRAKQADYASNAGHAATADRAKQADIAVSLKDNHCVSLSELHNHQDACGRGQKSHCMNGFHRWCCANGYLVGLMVEFNNEVGCGYCFK
jgi:hypothetical protein